MDTRLSLLVIMTVAVSMAMFATSTATAQPDVATEDSTVHGADGERTDGEYHDSEGKDKKTCPFKKSKSA